MFLVQHVRLPAQGWEEDANHPSEAVHEAYEVVFAPMVFVRKVGAEHFPFFILLPLSLRVQPPAFPLSWSQALPLQGPSTATELTGVPCQNILKYSEVVC